MPLFREIIPFPAISKLPNSNTANGTQQQQQSGELPKGQFCIMEPDERQQSADWWQPERPWLERGVRRWRLAARPLGEHRSQTKASAWAWACKGARGQRRQTRRRPTPRPKAWSHPVNWPHSSQDTKRWTEAAYLSNPTSLARSVFNNDYLIAKRAGSSLLKVWPCIPLARADYEFRPTHSAESCFEFLPITFKSNAKSQFAFLDPIKMVISPISRKASCEDFRLILVQIEGKIVEVDQVSGKITEVATHTPDEAEAALKVKSFIPKLAPHAFHQLVLLNVTDLATHAFASNLAKVSQMTYKIEQNDGEVLVTLSEEWSDVEAALLKGAIGDYTALWKYVITGIVAVCAVDVVIRIILTFLEARVGEGRLGRLLFGNKAQAMGEIIKKQCDNSDLTEIVVVDEKAKPKNVKKKMWPPRVTECPALEAVSETLRGPFKPNEQAGVFVIRASKRHFSCPVATAYTNGIPVRILCDTGSEVSVAPSRVVKKWGTQISKSYGQIFGLDNQAINILGKTEAKFTIQGNEMGANVLIAQDTVDAFQHFDLILGNDSLSKLKRITFDFEGEAILVGLDTDGLTPSTSQANETGREFAKWLYEFITDEKIEPITTKAHYKRPANLQELLHFLVVASRSKAHIDDFDNTIRPLKEIVTRCRDRKLFSWLGKEQKSYDILLTHLRSIARSESNEETINKVLNLLNPHTLLANRGIGHAPQTAIITAKINGQPVKCLVDTGATLTIAPLSLAHNLGCTLDPANLEAVSASGHLIKIGAKANVSLSIGNNQIDGPIHFVNTGLNGYHILLGCDIFSKLPPLTFDFENRAILIGEDIFRMEDSKQQLLKNLKVRATGHTQIKPGTQQIVEAEIAHENCIVRPVLVEKIDERLATGLMSLVPTVTQPNLSNNSIKIILCNPTNSTTKIYKGTTIAWAQELGEISADKILTVNEQSKILREPLKIDVDPAFKINFAKSSVEGEELEKLKNLCDEFAGIFSKSQYDLGSCTAGEHEIITKTDEPVASKPHRTPFKYRDELQKHIDQLLASGVMIESDTPWVSNIVLVPKKDGGLRPCIDFRRLNEITVPDHYPLPRLESIMEKVGNCQYYSSLDLSSGYLQIRLSENASRKCGLITENKVYQMINLPFGLRNATSAFARCMAHVLSGLDDSVVAYVDDILVFTKEKDFDEHLRSLRSVFERFQRFNLKLSPKKCIFGTSIMNFLGFTIGAKGYTPDLSKIEIIKNLSRPTNVRGVKHVVGMASFFRKHVPNFSTIVEPLTRLTRKEGKFEWGKEQDEAFTKVKQILSEKPVLIFPNYDKVFHIFTDASNVGQGGALMQYNEELSVYQAIAYCSRTMSASERKWPAVQAELGAIIYALRQFKPYIFMAEIELHCDHKPLAYLLKKADAHPNLARWLIELQDYNIKIVHIAGKHNLLADALSRFPHENATAKFVEDLSELEDIAEFPICLSLNLKPHVVHTSFLLTVTVRDGAGNPFEIDIRQEQKEDPEINQLIEFLKNGALSEELSEHEKEELVSKAENLCLESDILYFHYPNQIPRIFIPFSLRALIFDAFHNSPLGGGHLNLKKTVNKCKKYFWPRMHSDILFWTKQCITCQLRHSPNPPYKAEMKMPPANTLFSKVALDLAGPFPKTSNGNRHILNIICCFTKFVISVPIPDAKATTIAAAFFKNCFLKYGGCTNLLSDNASAFTSDFFKNFCSMLYINKCYATPHWSQGNGICERTFRTFHNILSKYLSRDSPDFDEYLETVNFCYNTAIHTSTNESPFFLMYGRQPIFCIDQIIDPKVRDPVAFDDISEFKQKLVVALRSAWLSAAEANKEAQLKAKTQYDKNTRNIEIKIGDRVLLRNYSGLIGTSKKFHMPWKGIFRVIDINDVHVSIISCTSPQSKPKIVHINQIKKCFEQSGPICTIPELPEEEKAALEEIGAKEVPDLPGFSHEIISENNSKITFENKADNGTQKGSPSVDLPARYNLRQNPRKKMVDPNYIQLVAIALSLLSLPLASARGEEDQPSAIMAHIFWLCLGMAIVASFHFIYYLNAERNRRATLPNQGINGNSRA